VSEKLIRFVQLINKIGYRYCACALAQRRGGFVLVSAVAGACLKISGQR
jgi:hypothetical protein